MRQLIGWFFKVLSFMIAVLPRSLRNALGDAIGKLWFDVLRIRRQVAIDNLGIAYPEKSKEERTKMARESLCHMGRTIMDYTVFPFLKTENVNDHYVFEGLQNLDAALKQGRGVILMTCHLGNGDFAIAVLSRLGYPMNLISKEFKSKWLNELWFGMRRKHGTKFISPEKSSFEILRALKRKEIVVFVLDQFMGPPIGVRTKFFGRETGTALGCALMANRTGAPVIPAYTYRRPDGIQVACFDAPIIGPSNDTGEKLDHRPSEENNAVMTQVYTDKIEEIIRRHPEQWMWIHRRWKEFRD